MLLVDIHEPEPVGTGLAQAAKEKVEVMDLPWGDIWILPWEGYTDLVGKVRTLADLTNFLTYIGTGLDEFIAESGAGLEDLAYRARETLLAWICGKSLVIESKTPSDFLNTFKADRLDAQALNMANNAKMSMFVIKGPFRYGPNDTVLADGRQYDWNYYAVMDKVTSLGLSGIPVVMVEPDRFADYVSHLALWFRRDRSLVKPPKPHTLIPLSPEANFLCGLPGIGPKLANSVLAYAQGNMIGALQVLSDMGTLLLTDRPEDLGPKRIQKIKDFLGLEKDEILLAKKQAEPEEYGPPF